MRQEEKEQGGDATSNEKEQAKYKVRTKRSKVQ